MEEQEEGEEEEEEEDEEGEERDEEERAMFDEVEDVVLRAPEIGVRR
jgi:hypothetical protein